MWFGRQLVRESLVTRCSLPIVALPVCPPAALFGLPEPVLCWPVDLREVESPTRSGSGVATEGRDVWSSQEKGHGFLRLREAIKQSCDIYFYEIARRLGVDRLAISSDIYEPLK